MGGKTAAMDRRRLPHGWLRLCRSVGLLVLGCSIGGLTGCDERAAPPKADLEGVVRGTAVDARFLHDLDAAADTRPESLIEELRSSEYKAPLEKDQFETTAQFQRRLDAQATPQPYGPGYLGFVQPVDYQYDADRQVMSFRPPDRGGFETSALYLQVGDRPALHLAPADEEPPAELSTSLPRNVATKYRNVHFRLAVIATIHGLVPPVLSGDIGNELLDRMDSGSDEAGFERSMNKRAEAWVHADFTIKAHIVRLLIFDPATGGAERPVFDWSPPSSPKATARTPPAPDPSAGKPLANPTRQGMASHATILSPIN